MIPLRFAYPSLTPVLSRLQAKTFFFFSTNLLYINLVINYFLRMV